MRQPRDRQTEGRACRFLLSPLQTQHPHPRAQGLLPPNARRTMTLPWKPRVCEGVSGGEFIHSLVSALAWVAEKTGFDGGWRGLCFRVSLVNPALTAPPPLRLPEVWPARPRERH